MKKTIVFLMLMLGIFAGQAQNTNYGTSSGTLGVNNSFFGYQAGTAATASSEDNSFFGRTTGKSLTTGIRNTAIGSQALYSNTTGNNNIALGYQTLYSNTTAKENTAIGGYALNRNTTGEDNTAMGYVSLYWNTTGFYNTSYGAWSLYNNTGSSNTATGYKALYSNTTGENNTAEGYLTLYTNSTGNGNTATGRNALYSSTGNNNTAVGYLALFSNTTGSHNTAVGKDALYSSTDGDYNTGVGHLALAGNSTGNNNSALGYNAGPATSGLSNTTALGFATLTTASNQVRVGNSSVTSIGGQVGWSTLSDGRFKRDVKEDVSGLGFINQLRPVSYSIDKDAFDKFLGIPDNLRQQDPVVRKRPLRHTGFVAQEVEDIIKKTDFVFHGIDAPQNEKDHYSIRYAEFVVPLVKAVQELSAQAEYQKQEIELLKEQLGIEPQNPSTGAIALFQNTPNPFSADTEIKMALPDNARQANIIIYNLEGKQLKSIPVRERGNAAIKISGYELEAGMYIYALIVDGKVIDTKRMILTK